MISNANSIAVNFEASQNPFDLYMKVAKKTGDDRDF
jgi:hypothetical protein